MSVTFSNILAKQVDRQRYLLEKEARKEQRRRRRNRSKFRDPFAESSNTVVVRQDETSVQCPAQQAPPLPGNHPAKKQSKVEIPNGYPPTTLFAETELQPKDTHDKIRKRSNDKNAPQRPSREMRKRRKIRERAISVGEPNQIVDKDAKKQRKRRTQSQDVKLLQEVTADAGKDTVQQKPVEPDKS